MIRNIQGEGDAESTHTIGLKYDLNAALDIPPTFDPGFSGLNAWIAPNMTLVWKHW